MARPRTGKALSAAERMRRYRARRRAAGLRSVRSWAPREATWSDHRIAEARSLAMHVMAVQRIGADPALLGHARATLDRWLTRYGERPLAGGFMTRSELERVIRAASAISKYAAGREKDLAFTAALARHGMTRKETLLERAARTTLSQSLRKLVEGRIARDFAPKRR